MYYYSIYHVSIHVPNIYPYYILTKMGYKSIPKLKLVQCSMQENESIDLFLLVRHFLGCIKK